MEPYPIRAQGSSSIMSALSRQTFAKKAQGESNQQGGFTSRRERSGSQPPFDQFQSVLTSKICFQ